MSTSHTSLITEVFICSLELNMSSVWPAPLNTTLRGACTCLSDRRPASALKWPFSSSCGDCSTNHNGCWRKCPWLPGSWLPWLQMDFIILLIPVGNWQHAWHPKTAQNSFRAQHPPPAPRLSCCYREMRLLPPPPPIPSHAPPGRSWTSAGARRAPLFK